ncbi:uncharacterized protein TRUGW13939_11564 [Talaromyces rugulosus]|uniref:Uncharacterized protein n=1 Tax=Talaromyces rugulosus TaxID=121627 RepID=A0A7H8RD27_TALRU|nr:uncharacterized protein TRUGW13939_11564 [Talaromyces rugulosus]QKX64390.1 hypothetical protein TRUGW13939_11564 [Talaromyces rugulosus]
MSILGPKGHYSAAGAYKTDNWGIEVLDEGEREGEG